MLPLPQMNGFGNSAQQQNSNGTVHTSPFITRETDKQENQLANMLVTQVLPSFKRTLKVQALIVYQADQDKMRCLLVNRAYKKADKPSLVVCSEVELQNKSSAAAEPNLVPNGTCDEPDLGDLSKRITGGHSTTDDAVSGSRRKRKFCRPCKIPQLTTSPSMITPTMIATTATPVIITPATPASLLNTSFSTPLLTLHESPKLFITSNGSPICESVPISVVSKSTSVADSLVDGTNSKSPSVASPFVVNPVRISTLPNGNRPILPRIFNDSSFHHKTDLTPFAGTKPLLASRPDYPVTSSCENDIDAAENGLSASALSRRYAKSFLCNQCRSTFASLSKLCEHTFAMHKSFRCTICQAQFTQRSNLQRHSLRHVGFKPFVCKICTKAYYRKDHLVRHIELTHPGSNPRTSLTVKLSSAECLEYLEKLYEKGQETTDFGSDFEAKSTADSVSPPLHKLCKDQTTVTTNPDNVDIHVSPATEGN